MYHDLSLVLALGFYLLAASFLLVSVARQSGRWRRASILSCIAGIGLHVVAQSAQWFGSTSPDVNLLSLLSLCSLVILVLLCVSTLSRSSLYEAGLVALPLTALALVAELVLPEQYIPLKDASAGTALHILSSILAFGVLCIAAVYAVFVAIIDHFLRRHHLNPLVRWLPPLEILENLLFQLIGIGFGILTISLLSGMAFIDDLFAQHLVHKTILSIMAWLVFGILLWGRWRHGWRGRKAVRLTLAGMVLLLLAYFGSKLVLEVILGRSWQDSTW